MERSVPTYNCFEVLTVTVVENIDKTFKRRPMKISSRNIGNSCSGVHSLFKTLGVIYLKIKKYKFQCTIY